MTANYSCCNDVRREAIKNHPSLNGIDFLEVSDNVNDPPDIRQTTLFVHFIKPIIPASLDTGSVIITGGDRIQAIQVKSVFVNFPASPLSPTDENDSSHILIVQVSQAGDFSTYTLQLITSAKDLNPPSGYDPILSSIDFSFKVLCNSDFDCKTECNCATVVVQPPPINYTAKDYNSFRQLILDRMAFLSPDWQERHAVDLGITLIELLAYTADYLSYRQDAIATEAYLNTARKRVSVRRHVRLVDYHLSDGLNARIWLQIKIIASAAPVTIKKGNQTKSNATTRILTRVNNLPDKGVFSLDSEQFQSALNAGALVFEPMFDTVLYPDHNELNFYTWGDNECCLPGGSTSATLIGCYPHLKAGQILIFREQIGPLTGVPEDADPSHQQAVCLVSVKISSDPLFEVEVGSEFPICSPIGGPGIPVTEIQWAQADALKFPLCISSSGSKNKNVSVAIGNIVLADHGLTIIDADTSSVIPATVPQPNPALTPVQNECNSFCQTRIPLEKPPRYQPSLASGPVTQAAPLTEIQSAFDALQQVVANAIPSIILFQQAIAGEDAEIPWLPQSDLLEAGANDRNFVFEVESDNKAALRFGDGVSGKRPVSGSQFKASFRIGNGRIGNIGPGSLAYIFTDDPFLSSSISPDQPVYNPMSGYGGTEPESIIHACQNAPDAFRTQERAVIAEDYQTLTKESFDDVQRAACTYRWTGSWRTAFVSIDRTGAKTVDAPYQKLVRGALEKYRMAGQDLEINGPDYVSLDVEMNVCALPGYFDSDIKLALLKVFSNKILPDGSLGVFHPDNFTFGQTLYLSKLYAAAQTVSGIASVQIIRFDRLDDPASGISLNGQIKLGQLEIARLDNDPDFPDRGALTINVNGGK
jgi:hypothetical protein